MGTDGSAKSSRRPSARRRPESAAGAAPTPARPSARRPSKSASAARPAASAPRAARPSATAPSKAAAAPAARAAGAHDHLQQIHGNLDSLLDDVDDGSGDAEARRRAARAMEHIAARLESADHAADQQWDASADEGGPRQLLSADYYLRRWGRMAMHNRSEDVDDYGLDPVYEAQLAPLLDRVFTDYFRVRVNGIEHVPSEGRALLISNHSGALPWDGVMLKTAVRLHHAEKRPLRWLAEDFAFHAPFLGAALNRLGAVRACPENAQRLLSQESLVAVFPEGIKGVSKLYRERYQLQRFGRGGYVKLALRTGSPLIPVAVVGAEETYPMLHRSRFLSKAMGLPFVPITPTFPLLGPLGLLPLPSRWQITFGPPVEGLDAYGPEGAEDIALVNELNGRVRAQVQTLLDRARGDRGERVFR